MAKGSRTALRLTIVTARRAPTLRHTAPVAVLSVGLALWGACADVAVVDEAPTAPAEVSPSTPPDRAAAAAAESDPPTSTARLDPGHTRVVWIQDTGDGTDYNGNGAQLVLMGLDSEDGRGERAILSARSNYAKPYMTPAGDHVVFSNRHERGVYVVRWDGTGLRRLAGGFALDVWRDPGSGVEWVYVGAGEADTRVRSYHQVRRYRIDDQGDGEPVWDRSPVSEDNFQLSADGRRASGVFPWPDVGLADLVRHRWTKVGEGCWTSLSPGGPSLLWYFDGTHRNLTLVDTTSDERWRIRINGAPGIDGFEVYHPRWSNHQRFFTMTGPYAVGDASNKIRDGGGRVEVYLGRFSEDFRTIEAWTQVTRNDHADFYPDAWIDPRVATLPPATRPVAVADTAPVVTPDLPRRVVLEVSVLRDAPLPTPASIAPYREGLLALEYQVLEVIDGAYPLDTIVAAHWVIVEGRVLPGAERSTHRRYRLVLDLYDDHPELEGRRVVMDADDVTLPLYYDASSRPE